MRNVCDFSKRESRMALIFYRPTTDVGKSTTTGRPTSTSSTCERYILTKPDVKITLLRTKCLIFVCRYLNKQFVKVRKQNEIDYHCGILTGPSEAMMTIGEVKSIL